MPCIMKVVLKSTLLILIPKATKCKKVIIYDTNKKVILIMRVERARAVGIFPKSVMRDKHGLRFPPAPINYTRLLLKREDLREKVLYNSLMEEKVICLGFELVPEILPSVRIKLGNKLAHRCRITRLTFLTTTNNNCVIWR